MKKDKKIISFVITVETIEKLKEYVAKNYGNRSFFIEKIINDTIENDPRESKNGD